MNINQIKSYIESGTGAGADGADNSIFANSSNIKNEKSICFFYDEVNSKTKITQEAVVKLPLQDSPLQISIQSNWRSLYSQALETEKYLDSLVISAVGAQGTQDIIGTAKKLQSLNEKSNNKEYMKANYLKLFWQGAGWDPINFDYHLFAIDDPDDDILVHLRKLSVLIAPRVYNSSTVDVSKANIGRAGTSYIANSDTMNNNLISPIICKKVLIAGNIEFNNCAITGVTMEFSNALVSSGKPVECKGRISFIPTEPPTNLYLSRIFK